MRVIIIGCEYAGTTTLAYGVSDWAKRTIGDGFELVHDHWKIPHTINHPSGSSSISRRNLRKSSGLLFGLTAPKLESTGDATGRRCTSPSTIVNSTRFLGLMPKARRMAPGMVTCPF